MRSVGAGGRGHVLAFPDDEEEGDAAARRRSEASHMNEEELDGLLGDIDSPAAAAMTQASLCVRVASVP